MAQGVDMESEAKVAPGCGQTAQPAEQLLTEALQPGDATEVISAGRDGEWLQGEELKKLIQQELIKNQDLTLNLSGLTHLDASALQILLAVYKKQTDSKLRLILSGISSELLRWFEVSGSKSILFRDSGSAL